MPQYWRTSDVAREVGVHPNTVRNYEAWGYLSPVPRSPSGYRHFTATHVDQMRLAFTILRYPYPGGKAPVEALIHQVVTGDLGGAVEGAYRYLARVRAESAEAESAARLLERWVEGAPADATSECLTIGATAKLLGLSTDVLRNWERNGLLQVPRDTGNRYRRYGADEIERLRVIRMLRSAGYGIMAILRLLQQLDCGSLGDVRQALDTPPPDEDILTVADRWLSTLRDTEARALDGIRQLEHMIAQHRA